jgi:crotonobetainyl-CoA:carnitine CoA-transferase CaiB-like acyl-CoA transferase
MVGACPSTAEPPVERARLSRDSNFELDAPARGRARPRHLSNDLGRNKESIAVNLRDPRGQELFRALVRRVGVVCENFTPRVKRQYGLGYEELTAVRPDLIMLSLCGYGQTGRMSNRPTFGPGIEASSGHARMTGFPDQPPIRPGSDFFADSATGFYAAFAIGAALLRHSEPVNGYAAHPHMISPFLAAGRPRATPTEAPLSGQDSRALLRALLDMPDAAIDALVADGVIAESPAAAAPLPAATDSESIRRRLEWRVLSGYDPDPGRTLGLPKAAEAGRPLSEVVS